MEYYSAIKKDTFESVIMKWMKLEPIKYTEWSKPERKTPMQYTNAYIWNLERWQRWSYMQDSKRHRCIEQSFGLWERARVEWFGRMALKHVYYHMWNESPVQFDAWYWMLGPGALEWPRGMVQGGRREEGSGLGARVHPWWIHVDVWQNQYNIVK